MFGTPLAQLESTLATQSCTSNVHALFAIVVILYHFPPSHSWKRSRRSYKFLLLPL